MTIGNREWTLRYTSLRDSTVRPSCSNQRLLVGGMVVSLLLFAVTWSLVSTRARAMQLAQQMTKSLRASETKLRAVISQAPLGIWEMDADGRIIDCNEKAVAYAGAPRASIIGIDMRNDVSDRGLVPYVEKAMGGESSDVEMPYSTSTVRKAAFDLSLLPPAGENRRRHPDTDVRRGHQRAQGGRKRIEHMAHHDPLTGLANRTCCATGWNRRSRPPDAAAINSGCCLSTSITSR
jgi:PAS domain-containing protein